MPFSSGRVRARRWVSPLVALLVAVLALPMATVPAAAAGEPQYLALTKSVSTSDLAPGDSYTYRVQVTCSEASCLDAVLADTMGELAGHELTAVTFKASDPALTYAVTWTSGGSTGPTAPTVVSADTAVRVSFSQPTVSPTGVGIQAGQTFTVEMTLQVPQNLAPGTDVTLDNDATVTATNSAPASDSATVHVVVPVLVDVATTKTWVPASQAFQVGAPSTIAVSATSAANVAVDRLVLQEPAVAPDGTASLPAANPFTLVDLSQLSATSVPPACTGVTVDAYVRAGATWSWVDGTPGDPADGLVLPDGVAAQDVAGLRVTCEGTLPVGAKLALDLTVEQRGADRSSGADLSTATHSVENVVSGTAAVAGQDDATRSAKATHQVVPAHLGTAVTKSFSPARVSAGQSSTLSLTATQTSDVAVAELRVSDLDFFGTEPSFTGFAAAPEWPTGADGATVVYRLSDDSTQDVTFDDGDVPGPPTMAPGVHVTGFEIIWTGTIEPDADPARATVSVGTVERTAGASQSFDNTATSKVTAGNGNTAGATDTARLTVLPASIDVTLTKTVRPSTALRPGDRAVIALETDLAVSSSYVTADELTVTDAWDGAAAGFWNGFDLEAIAPTQVPDGTGVTVQVQTSVGLWTTVRVEPARAGAWLLQMDAGQIAGELPGAVSLQDVTGVRFVLTDTDGFEENVTVTPYVVATVRSTLRTGGALPAGGTNLTNTAAAGGSGETEGGAPVTGSDDANARTPVEPTPPGTGDVSIDKRWSEATVAAQSGQQRSTTLTWRSRAGVASVAIADPADPSDVAGTVFDAFDLRALRPVAYSATPFSNGWYLRYDSVTDVQLSLPDGDGAYAWTSVAAPSGGWMSSTGFVGLTLTTPQRTEAHGVRLVLAENTDARVAAGTPGAALDPYAPAPGSGIAAASTDRTFVLDWNVREVRRSATAWVTASATYNTAEAGVVRNSVHIESPDDVATDDDDITIMDTPPAVAIAKTVSPTTDLYVPRAGVVDAGSWPARTFTVVAKNSAVARASYVRVTDPACSDVDVQVGCSLADPLADPFAGVTDWLAPGGAASAFDRFDLTGVVVSASIPSEVDLTESVAWLLHFDGTDYTSEQTTAATLLGRSAAQLADVVGVSVTFQGADPTTTGGTITQANNLTVQLKTRLRTHLRTTGVAQTLLAGKAVTVENHAYAQSYDPVLSPAGLAAGTDDAAVLLTGGRIDVAASKQISPATITAPQRTAPVTVTLGASSAASTLAPAEVQLHDDATSAPDFWDRFDLVGLGTVTMPAGADRVRADVLGPFGADDALEWVAGTPATAGAVTLPVSGSDLGDVRGIRFTFSRADGDFFSSAIPAPGWSAGAVFTVRLRDTTRDAGTPIAIDEAGASIENTVVVQSDRLTGEVSEERSTSALVTLSEGTHRLGVTKLANEGSRTVDVGASAPWDLTFTNTGTGYLTVTELRDALPAALLWTGETAPVVTTDDDGQMSDDVAVTRDGADIVLTWPSSGRTLDPGESVTVRLMLELQPGLTESDRATNTMTVSTMQTLDACTPLDATRPVTGAWAGDPTTCGATDYVSPRGGPNLFTVKGVRGAGSGAATADGQECSPLVHATGGDYYRTPCIARSLVGGTDDWVLRVVNGGTTSVEDLTIFDPLAAQGDSMIISGSPRGSVYRPQLVAESLHVAAPAGATVVTEVTTTASPCSGTWTGLATGAVCEQNDESWEAIGPSTDWAAVTGLRVRVDLRTTTAGALLSGQLVDVTFSTANHLASADAPDGVPAGPAADDVLAWNQFGVKYRDLGAPGWKTIAPAKMGVEVLTGPIEVRKVVTGPAASHAPTAFTALLTCTLDGVPLDLGADSELALDEARGYASRVDGLPAGTECDLTEGGVLGDRGEAVRSGTVHLTVDSAAGPDDAVPGDQVGTLTNTYAYGGLMVTKQLDTRATAGVDGPYTFSLACTIAATDESVLFDGEPELAFELRAGETFTAPEGTIPARATCDVRETGRGGADRVVMVGDGVTPTDDGEARVSIGLTTAEVTVTNGFDAGVLEVRKVVDGDGAAAWGAGPFGFTAQCVYGGATVLDETFTLPAGGSRTFGTYPTGTACTVSETGSGGATRSALAPSDGAVVITAPEGGEAVSTAVVTATNTFDVTSLDVVKQVDGDRTVTGASGPFAVELACTWKRDGERVELSVPGGAGRVLRAPTLTASYAGLPVGATCVLSETETGGADRTSWTVAVEGRAEVTGSGTRVDVQGLSTTTAPGQAVVRLVNVFDSVPQKPDADSPSSVVPEAPQPPTGNLPRTGADVARAAGLLVLLLALGLGLVAVARRGRRTGA